MSFVLCTKMQKKKKETVKTIIKIGKNKKRVFKFVIKWQINIKNLLFFAT